MNDVLFSTSVYTDATYPGDYYGDDYCADAIRDANFGDRDEMKISVGNLAPIKKIAPSI